MWLPTWLRSPKCTAGPSPRSIRRSKPTTRLFLEPLEDRTLPSAGWALGTTGIGSGSAAGINTVSQPDANGNTYVTGYFNGTVTLGSQTLTNTGPNFSSFVAKLDSSGNVTWAEPFGGGPGSGGWSGIATDTNGNVYLSGNFSGTQQFGPNISLTTTNSAAGYLCKIAASDGHFEWAQTVSDSTYASNATNIAVDSSGNILLGWHAAVVGNPYSPNEGFLSKFDANGNPVWTQQLATGNPSGVVVDASGNAYVSGNGGTSAGYNGLLAKYDPNGNPVWSDETPRPLLGISIYQNTLYTAVWPTAALPTDVQKVDAATGTVLASQQIGNPSVRPYAIATDTNGNVYLAGPFGGAYGNSTTDFDPGPGNATLTAQALDVFVVKLDSSLNFLSVYDFGGSHSNDGDWSVAVGPDGSIYTAGQFSGTTNFDIGASPPVPLTSSGNSTNLFFVKTTQDTGIIFGQVFNDLNNNGVFDAGTLESGIPGVTVYLDLNNSGSYVAGDPTAITDSRGYFQFPDVTPGSYTVRQIVPSGYTATPASFTLSVSAGLASETTGFADYTPSQTKSYASTNVPLKLGTKSGAAITSTLTVNDASTIFDLNLSINVTTTSTSLVFLLTSPDGTTVQVQAGTTHVTGFNYHGTKGTWNLKMYNSAPAPKPSTLNAWSFQILESTTTLNSPLSASPNSVPTGSLTVLPRKSAPAETGNGSGKTEPISTDIPNSESPVSVAEHMFADIALLLNAASSASQSQLSGMAALWQSADAMSLQRLDALLSMEAGAMGLSKDALMRDFLLAS